MKRKLLHFAIVAVACVNAFLFYAFTNGTKDACGNSGSTVNAKIRIQLPSSLGSNYEYGDNCGGHPLDFSI